MKIALALSALAISVASASAADLAPRYTKAPTMAVAPVYSWTGCYIGVEGGGNWGRSQHYLNDPTSPNFGLPETERFSLSGGLAGGTVGCNYQFANHVVVGIENDLSWTNKSGSSPLIAPFNLTETASTSESWLDTLRGRVGYSFDRVLVYGTGGVAFAREAFQLVDPVTGFGGYSSTVTGWTAGGGLEYAFLDNWSAKIEYLHADFGNKSYPFAPNSTGLRAGGFSPRIVSLSDDIVRVGVNYKFGWGGAVVAKY